jgi:hypothetical protein
MSILDKTSPLLLWLAHSSMELALDATSSERESSLRIAWAEPGYESIYGSGEVMRRKKQDWLIHSSSKSWRVYGSEVAKL